MAPCFHVDVDWLANEAKVLAGKSTATPRRPLVVGGSGLLGQNLVVLLASTPGCESVRVIDLRAPSSDLLAAAPNVEFVQHHLGSGDDESEEKVLLSILENVDCVFSVVTPHVQWASEADFYTTNETGVKRLVNACLKKGISRLVHLSSIAVTSHFHDSVNQSEVSPLPSMDMYESPYDISKRRGEDAVLAANCEGKLKTCSLRAGGICLSPWDFAFANAWPLLPGVIIQPRGKNIDFIDGRDVCSAMLLAAQGLEDRFDEVGGEAFFVTKGGSYPPGELAKYVASFLGLPFLCMPDWVLHFAFAFVWLFDVTRKRLGFAVPGIPPHRFLKMVFQEMTFDNSKAHKVLGWFPKVDVEDSVSRIVDLWLQEKQSGQPLDRRPNIMFSHLFIFVLLLSLVPYVLPAALTWH